MKKFRWLSLILILMVCLLIASPVLAIVSPTGTPPIAFGTGTVALHKIFYNVHETGDMLLLAESYINYTTPPTDYSASQAYIFQLLDAAGTTVETSAVVWAYGDRPVSIYLTAAQVTALGLAPNTAYIMRITANPAILTPVEGTNMVSVALSSNDWIDQSVATASTNPLRDYVVLMVQNIQNHDTPTQSYWVVVSGIYYLGNTAGTSTLSGSSLFLSGVPSLDVFCPSVFQTVSSPMVATAPSHAAAYANTLTANNKLGATIGADLTSLGTWLGLPQVMAGGLILMVITVILCIYLFQRLQSGVAPIVIGALFPVFGAYLGLLSLGVIFIFALLCLMLTAWFFLTRGII